MARFQHLAMALLATFAFQQVTASTSPVSAQDQAAKSEAKTDAKVKKKKRNPAKRLYLRRTCIACHGKKGARAIQDYPNLAGQRADYMRKQVKDILKGKRTGGPDATGKPRSEGMRGALVSPEGKVRITNDEIKMISDWLAEQQPAKPKPLEKPLSDDQIKEAKSLYKKKCRACHGKDALKPLKGNPIIAGQKRNYIIAQVNDIKTKARKNGRSATMIPFVKKLTDEQITLLADYLSQIDRTAK